MTGAPPLSKQQFAAVFKAIAEEVDASGYSLTNTSKAVRDKCRDEGVVVSRQDIGFILKGFVYSGYWLSRGIGANSPAELARTYIENVQVLCRRAQAELTQDEVDHLTYHLDGNSSYLRMESCLPLGLDSRATHATSQYVNTKEGRTPLCGPLCGKSCYG